MVPGIPSSRGKFDEMFKRTNRMGDEMTNVHEDGREIPSNGMGNGMAPRYRRTGKIRRGRESFDELETNNAQTKAPPLACCGSHGFFQHFAMRGRFGEFALRAEWRVTPYCPGFKGGRALQVFRGGEDGSQYWTRETSHGKMEISSPPKYGKFENI